MPKILISTLHPIRQRPAGPYLCFGCTVWYCTVSILLILMNSHIRYIRYPVPAYLTVRQKEMVGARVGEAGRGTLTTSTRTVLVRVPVLDYEYGTSTRTARREVQLYSYSTVRVRVKEAGHSTLHTLYEYAYIVSADAGTKTQTPGALMANL